MMAGYIMEANSIIVEVVENSETEFISFSVIGLWSSSSKNIFGVKTILDIQDLLFLARISLTTALFNKIYI